MNKICCECCDDGTGQCGFPQYGVAPHQCFYKLGQQLGASELLDQSVLPDNFIGDKETMMNGQYGCGVYTHCLACGGSL